MSILKAINKIGSMWVTESLPIIKVKAKIKYINNINNIDTILTKFKILVTGKFIGNYLVIYFINNICPTLTTSATGTEAPGTSYSPFLKLELLLNTCSTLTL